MAFVDPFDTGVSKQVQGGFVDPFTPEKAAPTRGVKLFVDPFQSVPGESKSGDFITGVKRGTLSAESLIRTGAGTVGEVFGADEFASEQFQQAEELDLEAQKFAPSVATVEDIESLGDFIDWSAGMLGEQVPIIASIVAVGAGTSGFGAVVGSLAARGLLTQAARVALQAKGASWAAQAAKAGGKLGVVAGAGLLETGGIRSEQLEIGVDEPGVALTGGLLSGALEVLPIFGVAKLLGFGAPFKNKLMQKIAAMGVGKRVLAVGAGVGASEAITETMQEAIALTAREFVDENYEALGEDGRSRLLNAAAAGFVVGGAVGGVGGIRKPNVVDETTGEVAPVEPDRAQEESTPMAVDGEVEVKLDPEAADLASPVKVNSTYTPRSQVVIIGEKGGKVFNPADRTKEAIRIIREFVPVGKRTPAQIALIRDADYKDKQAFDAKPTPKIILPDEKSGLSQITKLEQAKERLLSNPKYKRKDGGVKKNVLKRVAKLDAKIADLTPKANLNEREALLLNDLLAKDNFEGLSDVEYAQVEKLEAKKSGEEADLRIRRDKSEIDAFVDDVMASYREGVLRDSRKKGNPQGMTESLIRRAIAPLVSRLGVNVEVRNVESFAEGTEERVHAEMSRGFYKENPDGSVNLYLIRDNLVDGREAQMTYLHEVVGHFGVRQMLTEGQLAEMQKLLGADSVQAAEEYIAELAENPNLSLSLWRKVLVRIRAAIRKIFPNLRLKDDEIRDLLMGVERQLEGRVTKRLPPQKSQSTIRDSLLAGRIDGITQGLKGTADLDSWMSVMGAKVGRWLLSPLQLVKLYKDRMPAIDTYLNRGVHQWWNTKSQLIAAADGLAIVWNKLKTSESQKLTKALIGINQESERRGTKVEGEELVDLLLNKYKLETTERPNGYSTFTLYQAIVAHYEKILKRIETGIKFNTAEELLHDRETTIDFVIAWSATEGDARLQLDAVTRFAGPLETLDEFGRPTREVEFKLLSAFQKIEEEYTALRERNYIPHMRFGEYSLTVKAPSGGVFYEGKQWKAGQVMFFQLFESLAARNTAHAEVKSNMPKGSKLEAGVITDEEFSFMGIPPSLWRTLKENLDLNDEQKAKIDELVVKSQPGQGFARQMLKSKNVPGFNEDMLRAYAAYSISSANHIARVENYKEMRDGLDKIGEQSKGKSDNTIEGILKNYFNRHYNYIMNPKNDLAQLRAMGFIWYLGFNVKSALVNLTQVPMVAYPYLAHFYGDGKSVAEIGKAYGDIAKMFLGKNNKITQEESDIIQRLRNDGIIDESQAVELAGFSESDVLERLTPASKKMKLFNKMSYYSAFMFRNAEKYNRHVTALATIRLAKGDATAKYQAARDAIQASMFEYAKWNRPEFMRGKKSVFFLFWTFMQHSAFMAFGGHGKQIAMRYMLMMVIIAGMEGLPFAENLLDMIDWGSTKIKEATGSDDPYTDLRADIRGFVKTLDGNPDMFMHGLSRYYGLGPMHMLSGIGVPVPNVDISGSLSLGRVIPGIEDAFGQERDADKRFARVVIEAMGPVMGVPYALWRSALDDNPDSWKRIERAMPTFIKSASKAIRWADRGEEEFRGGGTIVDFDPQDMEKRLEVLAQGLGFASTRVGQRYEQGGAAADLKRYWSTKRTLLLEDYAYAIASGNPELRSDVMKAIRMFNHQIPARKLAITSETRTKSLKARRKRANLRSKGIPLEKAYRQLYQELADSFPVHKTEAEERLLPASS